MPRLAATLLVFFTIERGVLDAAERVFEVTLEATAGQRAFAGNPNAKGRMFVFLSQRREREPRFAPDWFNPEPFFGLDVKALSPGQTVRIDDSADGLSGKLSTLPAGKYRAQALFDHDFYEPRPADGVGNVYSEVVDIQVEADKPLSVPLTLKRIVEAKPFPATRFAHEVVFRSELLSKFHGRSVEDRCGVVLPASYFAGASSPVSPREKGGGSDGPESTPVAAARYPVMFIIPGFGGDHVPPQAYASGGPRPGKDEVEFIRVYLSGRCKWGHHVYADSATNGPRGRSLVEELIPLIDKKYRTVARPSSRFVTGHSSGGWSSLWLQVAYPDVFGGTWSTSPDVVDFRDYQQVDLYASPPQSLYADELGERRPIARRITLEKGKPLVRPVLWYDAFGRMDDVQKRGGQLRSFEAVFSPRGPDGEPLRLWDRRTGRIDPAVSRAWKDYDIRLKLEREWSTLGPKLRGKLHIITGEFDTFYLEGAVRRLGESLKSLGSDAVVEIVPGKDHGSVLTSELSSRIRREMSAAHLRRESK